VSVAKARVDRPVVEVYEDVQRPIRREFHRVNVGTLMNLAAEGRARVVYHPIVIFTTEPRSGDSLRAAAVGRCVTGGDRRPAFQDRIFDHRPPEGPAGSGPRDLVSYGRAAGMRGPRFLPRTREAVRRAGAAGGPGGDRPAV
jgi:hypothetical protein